MEKNERVCFKADIEIRRKEDGLEIEYVGTEEQAPKRITELCSYNISVLEKLQDMYIFGTITFQEYMMHFVNLSQKGAEHVMKAFVGSATDKLPELLKQIKAS